jgi:hypothetical protein
MTDDEQAERSQLEEDREEDVELDEDQSTEVRAGDGVGCIPAMKKLPGRTK